MLFPKANKNKIVNLISEKKLHDSHVIACLVRKNIILCSIKKQSFGEKHGKTRPTFLKFLKTEKSHAAGT